jgi:tetratricopeptide (TPR) repeat protein
MFWAFLYRQAGKMQKALDYLNEALTIEQNGNNHAAQAMTQNTMGRVYTDLGQEDKALALFQPGAAGLALDGHSAGRSLSR